MKNGSKAVVTVLGYDRKGIIARVSNVLYERGINILSLNTRTSKQGYATINVTFQIRSKQDLLAVTQKLRQVRNVVDITRPMAT